MIHRLEAGGGEMSFAGRGMDDMNAPELRCSKKKQTKRSTSSYPNHQPLALLKSTEHHLIQPRKNECNLISKRAFRCAMTLLFWRICGMANEFRNAELPHRRSGNRYEPLTPQSFPDESPGQQFALRDEREPWRGVAD